MGKTIQGKIFQDILFQYDHHTKRIRTRINLRQSGPSVSYGVRVSHPTLAEPRLGPRGR